MELRRRIERHLMTTGTRPTRLGREAAGDPRFVADLRAGRQVGPVLAARVQAWLDRAEESRP